MTAYPIPSNEQGRLDVLQGLGIDFSAPMEELECLARIASTVAGAPIALVSLVDAEVQRFAANIGLHGVDGTPREVAFCAHAIAGGEQLVVPDACADPRFRDNPLVTGTPGIRAYVGSPLEPRAGVRIGTLCVIDTRPRTFSAEVLEQLGDLSRAVTALLLAHRDRMLLRERLELEAQQQAVLRNRADRDPLTGLLNQAGFRKRADAALARATGTETLAIIDIDHFKQVNDRWGHPFGDRYLQTIAEGLVAGLGPQAIVGRIGGDEFAALLPPARKDDHLDAIERACTAIRAAAGEIGKPQLGRLSIGLCYVSDAPEPTFEALYQRADVALYATKDRGRNGATTFSTELDARYNFRAQRARFAEALSMGEVEPFFQPKVDLADGRVLGFELLVRWRDPKRGLLEPAHFLKLLTDRAIAPELTRHMISGAIEVQREARERGIPRARMAVNVSHYDFADPAFVDETEWRLAAAGLDWGDLALEVSERTILDDTDFEIRRTLERVRNRGCEVALDDFGTGHAGLLHLREWPIDVLKLDQAFVKGIADNSRDETIVSSIIDLATRLGLGVVAEGVETRAVAERLRAIGCTQGQGFLFSPAVEQEVALGLLAGGALPRAGARRLAPGRRTR